METKATALTLPAITPRPSRKEVIKALVQIEYARRMKEKEDYENKVAQLYLSLKKKINSQLLNELESLTVVTNASEFPFYNVQLELSTKENKKREQVVGIDVTFTLSFTATTTPALLKEATEYQELVNNEFSWKYTNLESIEKEIKEAIKAKTSAGKSVTTAKDLIENPSAKIAMENMLNVLFNEEKE